MNSAKTSVLLSASLFAVVAAIGIHPLHAQEPREGSEPARLHGYSLTEQWTAGAHSTASLQSLATTAASTTIPMSTYSFVSTKDGRTYTGTLVGTNPFAAIQTGSNIPVLVVPLKITVGTTVFDPTAGDLCDGNVSAVNRFNESPLIQSSPLTFNGVNVGTTQFANGFQRAEFWNEIGGSTLYQNALTPVTYATAVSVTTTGQVYSSGCSRLGIVGYSWMSKFLSTEITALQKAGTLSPSQFAIFLVRNVVQSTANPPSTSGCCILGFHSAVGSPVQTYGVMDWDTTGDFGAGTADGSISSHEIAEWMNDPLGTNPTPAWGGIGQVSGCQNNFEVGDPLSGTLMPAITLNGKAYHMQEMGFFSWYFNKNGVASLGAGGKFSGNGTFKGPAKACPPGGTN